MAVGEGSRYSGIAKYVQVKCQHPSKKIIVNAVIASPERAWQSSLFFKYMDGHDCLAGSP